MWHVFRSSLVVALLGSPFLKAFPADSPHLGITPPDSRGWIQLSAPGQTGVVYTIQASTNLSQWAPIASVQDGIYQYPDPAAGSFSGRFYRLTARSRTADDDWKNQVHLPQDRFLSNPGMFMGPDLQWIKFAIVLEEPFRVFYQDSGKYPFHFDFATKRLEPFRGMSSIEFDQVALRTNRQQVLLGTILAPPAYLNHPEYGIQFVGQDPYPAGWLSEYFDLVKSTVVTAPGVSAFYVPTFEQARAAETNSSYFESRGIRLASVERWIKGNDVYSMGWALGQLKFFPGTEINAAFADGRLQPQDILLTDGVPAEIPVLAGVLTLAPSTPNSHAAILAKSFGLPFAYISDPGQRQLALDLAGKEIVFRIQPYSGEIKLIELESSFDPAIRAEVLALKSPPKLNVVAKEKYGRISASTDPLTPADIKYFGGKAANFGILRRQVPDHSPAALAFSFDLWDEFLDQVLPGGRTLRAEIESRLAGYAYPANVAALQNDLAGIRDLITRTASFSEAQKQAILEALAEGNFDATRKIRFRSSTNVEDSEQFTGAGLYDSFSGCLADDLDNDSTGPSHCDPTEAGERGVFRAIQKVYASFYNNNAFLERLRHGVDEGSVGMALLVHYSAPDETELANGVAIINVQRGGNSDSLDGDLVTQKGAVSVANPDGSARPEVIRGYHHAFGTGGFPSQRSALVPLGAYVLEWDREYIQLLRLLSDVADGYHQHFPHKKDFTLDFEYKKLVPGVLQVKQVREVPSSLPTNAWPAYLVHESGPYEVFQGEAADVFSNHRLKSFWSFHSRNTRLTRSNLLESLFTHIQAEYLEGQQTNHISGAPGSLPNASHAVNGNVVVDRWSLGSGANRRDFELRLEVPVEVYAPHSPVLSLSDLRLELVVNYATPQPVLQMDFPDFRPELATNYSVVLQPPRALTTTNFLQERVASAEGVTVQTSFYWPGAPDRGMVIEKTAPLGRWKETRIEGLTSQPIVLRGVYSQTYRPGHHNFSEEFIFQPDLEGGLPQSVLDELRAANVQLLHVLFNFERKVITILGLDGQFRTLREEETPGKGGGG